MGNPSRCPVCNTLLEEDKDAGFKIPPQWFLRIHINITSAYPWFWQAISEMREFPTRTTVEKPHCLEKPKPAEA